MKISYQDLITQISPYSERVFYCGLSEAEIQNIENEIGNPFPDYFREFLRIFGVRQDFVDGLFTRDHEFACMAGRLPEAVKKLYIAIGVGNDSCWLLNVNNPTDKVIYEWQFWDSGAIVKLDFTFEDLLQDSINGIPERSEEFYSNKNKYWCVQFAIETDAEHVIYSLASLTPCDEWRFTGMSPSQVGCYERKVIFAGKVIPFRRQEYSGWDAPKYYFDLKEHVSVFLSRQSLILDLDTKLKGKFPNYHMVDYGILVNPPER